MAQPARTLAIVKQISQASNGLRKRFSLARRNQRGGFFLPTVASK
jgi:hypothetical protein